MRFRIIFAVSLSIILVSGCRRAEESSVLKVIHDGNEYAILDRGDTVADDRPAYFVRYYSGDIADESVLRAERADLCTLIAKHIDTNKHQRVIITAVERKGRLFGLREPREVSQSLSLPAVMKYHPDAKAPEGR